MPRTEAGVRVGYARVSTSDQNAGLQTDALEAAGAQRIFADVASGALDERPQLAAALDYLRPGDTLVVWRLDRLGRSLKHLIATVDQLRSQHVEFASLSESIDTSTPAGRLIFHTFASLAEFERELISERTRAGLAAARARGRVGGRPPVMTPERIQMARQMYNGQDCTVATIARTLGVSRGTIYNHLGARA